MTDKSNTQAANHLSAEAANALLKRVAALREPFETWATGQGYTLAFEDRGYMQTYRFTETEHAWRGYCHAALAAQPTPEPTFTGIAARKLDGLKGRGYVVDGYSIQHAETKQRGFITAGGFVGWWINMDHVQPTPEPVAQAEEIERLRKALVYVAFALHATPQHQLATGISLIDADTVQVRLDGWMIEASTNPARQPAAPSPVALQGRDEVKAIMEEIAEYGRVSDACGRSRGPNNYAMNESAVARFVDLQEEIHRDLIALAARASLPAGGVVDDTDVRSILLDVVPGPDGMGQEVYAQNVGDVERKLSELCDKLESHELGNQPAPLTVPIPDGYDSSTLTGNRVILRFESQDAAVTWLEGFYKAYDAAKGTKTMNIVLPPVATPQPSETQGRRQMMTLPDFDELPDEAIDNACAAGGLYRADLMRAWESLRSDGIPASPQDGGANG